MDRAKELESIFARHWQAFLQEAEMLDDTPENRERAHLAMEAVIRKHKPESISFGVMLARHWEPFMAKLFAMARSEETRERLAEAWERLLFDQIREFSKILGDEALKIMGQTS